MLNSPVMWPGVMTRLMACPPTCGAAAAIVCSAEFAKKHGLDQHVVIAAQAMTTDTPSTFDSQDMRKVVGYDMSAAAARQVYEDAAIGRLYLPREELRRAGWYERTSHHNRSAHALAARPTTRCSRRATSSCSPAGRHPTWSRSTRRPAGAEPRYKIGVMHLYAAEGVPCVPIALNSGLFWPRRQFLRRPGTIVISFLDPIPPGLSRKAFQSRLQTAIETETECLVTEGRESTNKYK